MPDLQSKEGKMKKIITTIFLLLFICSGCTDDKLGKQDCAEAGVCAEGLEYSINNDTFIVSKETCINHNKKWNDDLKVCYMY